MQPSLNRKPRPVKECRELSFAQPFDVKCRFMSEPNSHILPFPPRALAAAAKSEPVPLVIGQPVLLAVTLRPFSGAASAAPLVLLDVQLAPDTSSGLQLMSDPRAQLPLPPPAGAEAGGASVNAAVKMLLHFMPTRLVQAATAGKLLITWQRPAPPPAAAAASISAAGKALSATAATAPDAFPLTRQPVVSVVDLPAVNVLDAHLAVKTLSPPQAAAGISFPFTLHVQNFTGVPQVGQTIYSF